MDKQLLETKPSVNYSEALQPYGFDVFSAGGDIGSDPRSGFDNDPFIAGEAVRWLRANASEARRTGQPFFMVAASSILTTSCLAMATSRESPPSSTRS